VADNSAETQQLILTSNQDGWYTIWFDPIAPEGHENNWIQTLSGKSDNVRPRLYRPLELWFDKTWGPGDFEIVE
jgi:hypothetical protein